MQVTTGNRGAGASRAEVNDILASRKIEHVVVLGANGTMGYGSGALFTRAVPRVTFLARSKEKAEQGLAKAIGMVRSATVANHVDCGSYDELFDSSVADADLVFEAVTERLDVKREIFERVDRVRREDSVIATVTSGLSINQLAEGRSESFRANFLGWHFFNPPNVIVGTELIAGKATDPKLVDFIELFSEKRLGRVMIRTADTAGFAGNRIGFKVLNEVCQLAEEHGPLLVDRIIGPHTGRALPPLATVDLVGWDIHRAIVDNIYENAADEAHDTLALPGFMAHLMERGTLGRKTGRGFTMRDGGRTLALDPKTGDYTPVAEITLPDLSYIDEVTRLHRLGDYRAGMQRLLEAPGPYAALARKVVAGYVSYAFHRVGEVTDTILGIDLIMGLGFNWAPPSVLVDTLGPEATVRMMEESAVAVPECLREAVRTGGPERFFTDRRVNVGKFFVAS